MVYNIIKNVGKKYSIQPFLKLTWILSPDKYTL